MRDIEEMMWDLQYEAEMREKEYRKLNARTQELLNEKLDFHLKSKNPNTFTLSELKTIVASRTRDGKADIKDKALKEKYWDFMCYESGFETQFDEFDDDEVNLGDRCKWFLSSN